MDADDTWQQHAADTLRESYLLANPVTVQIVTEQAEAGRTIAAICHAPWILAETGLAEGKTLTGYQSIRTDLKNAGATVVDEEVKVCQAKGWTLITSRTPDDLDAFVKAIDEA